MTNIQMFDTAADEANRVAVRSQNHVELVQGEQEGSPARALPAGTYGFTYAPFTESPVFARRSYHSFELHRTKDGEEVVVCYVAGADEAKLQSATDDFDLTVYPDPWAEADRLVTISSRRVLNNNYKTVRLDGNALPLRVAAF
jgi:hypothetical protein